MAVELHSKRVLVVDDDAAVRLVLVEEFESTGCAVTEAGNGAEALDCFGAEGPFDLLVTDVQMLGVDGWTLAERTRVLQPDLPVLYVTGSADTGARSLAASW